jgi:hypothetical protein
MGHKLQTKKFFRQRAVYWPKGPPSKDGKETFGTPVQIRCRWEDTQVEVKDATRANGVWSSKSVVDTDHPVQKGGYLWKGDFSRLADRDNPKANADASRIEYRDSIPSVEADQTLYTAYL